MPAHIKEISDTTPVKHHTAPPPMYNVLLLNDDFTPMDFVVDILMSIFHWDLTQATKIMLNVHQDGQGLCGVYTKDIAATKVSQVINLARANQHPLQCIMEISE